MGSNAPLLPMATVTAMTTALPCAGRLRLLLSLKTQIELWFTLKMLSISAVFAPWTYASLVVGGVQGGHVKHYLPMGKRPMPLCLCSAWGPRQPRPRSAPSHRPSASHPCNAVGHPVVRVS